MEVWKIIFLSKWVICMFHVNLPGCNMFAFASTIEVCKKLEHQGKRGRIQMTGEFSMLEDRRLHNVNMHEYALHPQ